jgi:hypothetical protein
VGGNFQVGSATIVSYGGGKLIICFLVSNDPDVKYLEPQYFHEYKSERVRIKYGPYEVPPSHIDNGMKNYVNQNATMPCHDCLITWFQADLVYPDGATANADTGMWLHHTVLTNGGKEDVKGCHYRGERFFASGNERTLVDISMNGCVQSSEISQCVTKCIQDREKRVLAFRLRHSLDDDRTHERALLVP